MRTSALLYFTSACALLDEAWGGCTGKVRPYAHYDASHSGCHEVYVSCWTKLGDSCDYEFTLPPWVGGYERVAELAGDKDTYYNRYPSEMDVLSLTSAGGRLHCGSDDGSVQWKNFEDVVVCRKSTSRPTPAPTPGPTATPTPAPTASVPLSSTAVRQALDGLCATMDAGEECLAEAREILASLIAEATADGGGQGDDGEGDEEEGGEADGGDAAGGGVDVVAAAAASLAGGTGLAAAPILLAAAVAAAVTALITSYLGRGGVDVNSSGNHRREYAPVPDADEP